MCLTNRKLNHVSRSQPYLFVPSLHTDDRSFGFQYISVLGIAFEDTRGSLYDPIPAMVYGSSRKGSVCGKVSLGNR